MLYVRSFARPRLVLSACLNLKPVRYNGLFVRDEFVLKLTPYCELIEVCPEVAIGLGVPREKVIVYLKDGQYRLFQPATGLELTERMLSFAEEFIGSLSEIDGFILKSKSPSCGVSNTMVYKDEEGKEFLKKGKGLFAMEVLKRFEDLPVEDEGRLKNKEIREHFLSRLFAVADMRESLKNIEKVSQLMEFHKRYKYFLMAHSQVRLKAMGKKVAEATKGNLKEALEEYHQLFLQAIKRKPSRGQHANTILHIFGHLSRNLNKGEKAHFLKLVEDYKHGRVERKLLIEFLKSYAYRFENTYLISQTYLEPYPEELEG